MAPPCRFFALGTCRNGSSCPFSHDSNASFAAPAPGGAGSKAPCRFFAQGTCRYGAGCAFSHDLVAQQPVENFSGYRPDASFVPQQPRYGGYPQQMAYAQPPPQFGQPAFGFMPGPPMGGPPMPQAQSQFADYDDGSDDEPPTPAYQIRPGMTFEQIMAMKKAAPHEYSDRAGVFDPNLALDAVDEHVAALRDYLAQIVRRAPASGSSDPLVISRSHPKPTGSFAAVRRVFDRLRQTKALDAENGGKVDDAGFMVIASIGDLDEQVRNLGIAYGSSLFPVHESGFVGLMEYAEANCDPEMQSMIASFHSRLISRNSSFAQPRAIVSLEDDYDARPLPSNPTPLVQSVLSNVGTSLVIPPETTRTELATLLSSLPSPDKITSLSLASSGLPPTDLGRLFTTLPNLSSVDLSSIPQLTTDTIQHLARLCPKLKKISVRGHPDDHSSLDEGILTALGHGTEGCFVEAADQFWLGRGFVEGRVARVYKGRGGAGIVVGEAGEEVEL